MRKKKISWKHFNKLIDHLYATISYDNKQLQFDTVLGISRGGLVPGVVLSHLLSVNFVPVSISNYDDTVKREEIVFDDFNITSRVGERILIVDDIADTGYTLQTIKKVLNYNEVVRTCVLHYKKEFSQIKPDYIGDTAKKWIVYPWEK